MTEAARGCYVYCVVPASEAPRLEGLSGVDSQSSVEILTHGELSAVVSAVSLEEFGADALKRNLEDLDWLERTARAHDAVLARVLTGEAIVPLRLCTIFDDEQRAREMLDSQRVALLDAIARLRNRVEWSAKLLADPSALARERTPSMAPVGARETEGPGRAFFARKKLERAADDEAHAAMRAVADDVHTCLSQQAVAAVTLRPQHPHLSGRAGQMVLNGAYLVDRAQEPRFVAVAQQLAERYGRDRVDLELSGPWAPYNFVDASGADA